MGRWSATPKNRGLTRGDSPQKWGRGLAVGTYLQRGSAPPPPPIIPGAGGGGGDLRGGGRVRGTWPKVAWTRSMCLRFKCSTTTAGSRS